VPGPDLPDVGGEEAERVPPVLLLAEEVRPLDEVNQPLSGHRLLLALRPQSQFFTLIFDTWLNRTRVRNDGIGYSTDYIFY
jgi:hypothetical protein